MILFNRKAKVKNSHSKNTINFLSNQKISSKILNRVVEFDVLLPPSFETDSDLKTVYFNDGQELNKIKIDQLLSAHFELNKAPFIYVGVYANADRIEEYGTKGQLDFKQRGKKAQNYQRFLIEELMPHIQLNYKGSKKHRNNFIAGFSMGGLSALDTLVENPNLFSKVGVFSGSLWWRRQENISEDSIEEERIMHSKIKDLSFHKDLKFWFECGSADETLDRNNNGVIDVIDDTLDFIQLLREKGYSQSSITYVEIKGGEHNFQTWVLVLPYFFQWLVNS